MQGRHWSWGEVLCGTRPGRTGRRRCGARIWAGRAQAAGRACGMTVWAPALTSSAAGRASCEFALRGASCSFRVFTTSNGAGPPEGVEPARVDFLMRVGSECKVPDRPEEPLNLALGEGRAINI